MSAGRENAGCSTTRHRGSHFKNHAYKDTQQPQVYRLPVNQFTQTNNHLQSAVGDLLPMV
jgi:hypothetical protein